MYKRLGVAMCQENFSCTNWFSLLTLGATEYKAKIKELICSLHPADIK